MSIQFKVLMLDHMNSIITRPQISRWIVGLCDLWHKLQIELFANHYMYLDGFFSNNHPIKYFFTEVIAGPSSTFLALDLWVYNLS